MSANNLPDILLKLGLALAKYQIKKAVGDEALEIVTSTMTDMGGEIMQEKVDSIFASKEGKKELLAAAQAADQRFRRKCKNSTIRQIFTMEFGDLPSVQDAIAQLPKELDDENLRQALFKAFRWTAPKHLITDKQMLDGVDLYIDCLQRALLSVKDYGIRIIYNELMEISGDVRTIKADVKLLLAQATDAKNLYARFFVPFPHNPDFVGRDVELAEIHKMLQQNRTIVGIRPTVLVGLGGIGKTQLAVEYAHVHRDDYPSGVFWLNAINPLLLEFAELAEELEMVDRGAPRDIAALRAWDYLDTHPDSLVIFDNVLEPSELNVPFSPNLVPANLRCSTLFTTRQRDFPRNFRPFEVKVLPEMAAMHLLLRSRPEVLEEHNPEWGWARIVCAELGWLPLALELAAAYLGAYPEVSITDYLERLRTEGSLETVDESDVSADDLPTRVEEILKMAAQGNLEQKHKVAVSATLLTQWNRLDENDTQLLFRAAGQFPEASWIPMARLSLLTGIEGEAKSGHPSPLSVALKKLHAVSLIEELSNDRLRLHPLVQEFASRLFPAAIRVEMAERIAAEFNDLMQLQARVIRYGVDFALEDIRTGLSFCIENPETKTYSQVSKLEQVLDRQAHGLREWDAQEEPVFFLQQILQMRNEAYVQNLKWQGLAQAELARLKKNYFFELFPNSADSAELRTLAGHSESVEGVALSADGRLAVSASRDKTLKVWDIPTGRELRTLSGHSESVEGVALSADGRLAVSASRDKTLKVWDIPTGRELRTLSGHSDEIRGVALSADGRLAVSASRDKTLKVWDVSTGRELSSLFGHSAAVNCISLRVDGQLAVSASADTTIKVWNLETGQELRTLDANIGREHIMLSANGQLIVSAGDAALKVWDAETGQALRMLGDSSMYSHGLALSADARLAVCAVHTSLLVWNVQTGRRLVAIIMAHKDRMNGVALSADGRLAVSASFDHTLKVWDIFSALNDNAAREVSVETTRKNRRHIGHEYGSVGGVALSADGQLAVSASLDKTLRVWEVATGRELSTLTGHSRGVYSIAMSANGRIAVSASADKTVRVWNIYDACEIRTLSEGIENVSGLAISADGQMAVCAYYFEEGDKKLWIINTWDVETGRELRKFTGQSVSAKGLVLSADGRYAFYAAREDYGINVLDLVTGHELRTLVGSSESVICVALSADARLAVSAAGDQTLRVYDMESGNILQVLTGHSDLVSAVALSADGQLAVSVSDDMFIKAWNPTSGQCIASMLLGTPLHSCVMSSDGKQIIVGDSGGGIHFLQLVGAGEIITQSKE